MAVALVNSGVGREEVEVLVTFGIPYVSAAGAVEHDGKGVVIVGRILLLPFDSLSGGESGCGDSGHCYRCVGKESSRLRRWRRRCFYMFVQSLGPALGGDRGNLYIAARNVARDGLDSCYVRCA